MKKRYIALTSLLFLLNIPNTYASCTQEEINEFKKIENEYKVTYEFNTDTKDYNLLFYTPMIDKYDYYIYTDKKLNCKEINEKEAICYNVPIDEYLLKIVGVSNTCNDVLKEITLKLPEYNKYSEDPLCDGIEEFYLCQPTYEKKIDRETFESRVNTYKNTYKNQEEEKEESEPSKEDDTLKYIKENLIQITIITVFIILVIITIAITAKSIRESRRLE